MLRQLVKRGYDFLVQLGMDRALVKHITP
jgi:hypothetical protein